MNKDAIKYGVILSAALFLFWVGVPVAAMASTVIITYYYIMHGPKFFVGGAFALFLCMLFVSGFDVAAALLVCLYLLPLPLAMGYGFRRQRSFRIIMITSSAASALPGALILLLNSRRTGQSVGGLLFSDSYEAVKNAFSGMDGGGRQYLEMMEYHMDIVIEGINGIMPSVLVLSSLFTAYIIFGIVRWLLGRAGRFYSQMPYFYQLRLRRSITSIFLVIFMVSSLFGISPVTLNVIIVITAILMVCGLSVLDYYLKFYNIPGPVRAIIYVIIFGVMPFLGGLALFPVMILFAVGTADSYMELRRHTQVF